MNTFVFKVQMPCGGCSRSTEAFLKNIPDFSDVKVSLEKQTVQFNSNLPLEKAYKLVKESGKNVQMF